MNGWIDHAVWWHVYPLGFTGGLHGGPGHRFGHLIDWLDYAIELGVNGLQLGPIFASESHGYDTVDHFRIDPRLGDDADFDKLVSAARERGMRVLLDGVFNHVGRGFQAPPSWFRDSVFEGHGALVELDHDNPEVQGHVVRVMDHWLARGASGWRLDAAYAVQPGFWKQTLARVRAKHPDAWFTGEVIHGDYAAYLRDSTLDSVSQYELFKAVWSSLNDRNFYELAWALDRHNTILDAGSPLTFVGNHDVTRIATQLSDFRHLGHALAVLFTTGGVPSIYYGDEQAYRGRKEERFGGDDDIRPLFPARPGDLSALGWPTYHLHQRLIGIRRRHPWLAHARTRPLHLANEALALESSAGDNRLITLLNTGDAAFTFPIDPAGLTPIDGDGRTVPPHSWSILG
ncbi:alpha-amylase family glycosyl hydrolase [Actinoplanes sp. DH11]|uniref:alpha-amylase family glycosyl hydrolase n=1 Tax=Actinoplanes sp. DH11 TaxID=2857011 RepID=UPI001E4C552D|nr:alpha-amylase family glycosyl hydrolase [Actinoplanes sp. DH11]